MSKFMKIAGITYLFSFVAGVAMIIWMYAFPKSYGKFIRKWSDKVLYEDD